MINNLIVHAWELQGYAKVDKHLRDTIRLGLKNKYGTYSKANDKLEIKNWYHKLLHKKRTQVSRLFKLIDEAEIEREHAEKHITEWSDNRSGPMIYNLEFPILLTPLHCRVLSHIIGDGYAANLPKNYREFVWVQNDVAPMKELEIILVGKFCKRKRKKEITIPKILVKLICKPIRINIIEFDKKDFLISTLSLPKDFRVQTLTAIIEDEGTIVPSGIIIRMGDKEIVENIARLIDSLSYKRGKIKRYWGKSPKGCCWMYKINLTALGLWRYYQDLKRSEKKYGEIAGLWKKREKLEKHGNYPMKTIGRLRNTKLSKVVLKILKKRKLIEPIYLIKKFKRKPNQIYSLLRFMSNKGYIQKVRRGIYKLSSKNL